MSILVIAAHPDDETLGCGGAIAKYSSQGEPVHIVILGEGVRSRSNEFMPEDSKKINTLQQNGKTAAGILGAKNIFFESFPDNRFDSVPLLDIVKTVEIYIERFKPHTIFTHHGGDLNIDHSISFRAVITAARPLPGTCVKNIYAFETLSATEWAFETSSRKFKPNLFINIEPYLEKKIAAMTAYETEIRQFPHPRSAKAIAALAHRRGSMAGYKSGEAFSIIRQLTP
jgi:LmbE family N-acetylglucosaminyl deacetylase